MPITIARPSMQAAITNLRDRRLRRGVRQDRSRRLRIQLVNNMPDAAVFATQRQFIRLLDDGAQAFDVTLGLMTLSSVDRSVEARAEMAGLYRDAAHLAASSTDAIIVTGAEPRAAELFDEPYWPELTRLFDTARAHSFATLASCLAAHALVLHQRQSAPPTRTSQVVGALPRRGRSKASADRGRGPWNDAAFSLERHR